MNEELRGLIERVCTDTVTPAETDRLNAVLRESEEARRLYLDYLGIHARLSWEFGPPPAAAPREMARLLPRVGSLAAAALLLGILVFVLRQSPSSVTASGGKIPPLTLGRLDTLEVLPAAPGLVIDGDLGDWSAQGRFRSELPGTDGKQHWVEGQMRYDSRMLYISARIGDPFPLRSRRDPRTEAALAWMGGALQVRLSTDRARPWPVQADHLEIRRRSGREKRPEDAARSLVHLTMWYDAPRKEACLHLAYGMEFEGDRVNPEGYQGVLKADPKGEGYVLEYAIPWELLGAGGNPPQAGDTLAASWTVTWSDESGRDAAGQLVEILNPDHTETRWTFMRAGDWGKALYR